MSPTPYRGNCAWCGKEVWANRCVKEVTAWESERAQGGANSLQGPNKRYSGRIMHTACHTAAVLREKSGLIPGQLSIE